VLNIKNEFTEMYNEFMSDGFYDEQVLGIIKLIPKKSNRNCKYNEYSLR
jgi:hypothetical protein